MQLFIVHLCEWRLSRRLGTLSMLLYGVFLFFMVLVALGAFGNMGNVLCP